MNVTSEPSTSAREALRHPVEALKHVAPSEFVETLAAAPDRLRAELRDHPLRTLGLAVGLGVGIGVIASSRVARFLVWNLGGYAATELARRGAKRYLEHLLAA